MRWSSFLYSVHGSNKLYEIQLFISPSLFPGNITQQCSLLTIHKHRHIQCAWAILNASAPVVAIQLVFWAKLGIAVHEWKRSAESILMLNIHFPVFPWYIWSKLNKLLKYKKYQLSKRWLEGKLEGFFRVS